MVKYPDHKFFECEQMGQTLSSSDWAKKEVLDKIQIATESSARSLTAISRLKDSGLDQLTQGAQAAGAATAGMAESRC